jgi:hypothetical protein
MLILLVSIIDKDKLEAAEEVLKTNSAEVTDVRREIDALKQDHHETLADLDRHRELLGKARLDRDNARKLADDQAVNMQETGKANDDVKASLAKIESKLETQADKSTSAELKEYVNDLSEKVVEARKKLLDRAQVTEQDILNPVEFITVKDRSATPSLNFPAPRTAAPSVSATPQRHSVPVNAQVTTPKQQSSVLAKLFARNKKQTR